MNKKIYIFLEKFLNLSNYRDKLIFVFLISFLISLTVYSFYYSYITFKEKINFAEKGIENAVKIRASLMEERLNLIRDSFQNFNFSENILKSPLIKGIKYEDQIYNFPKCEITYTYNLCNDSIIIKIKDNFYISISTEYFKDILDPKKGMISIYNPTFSLRVDKHDKTNICSLQKIEDTNFTLEGCIDKNQLKYAAILPIIKNNISLFLIFILFSYLLFRMKFQDVILFPLNYLKDKIRSLDVENMGKVSFDLHHYIKDEFGELSEILEKIRLETVKFNKEIDLVFDTTAKMTSYTNDIFNFILFTLNRIENIFEDIQGLFIVIYNKENFSDVITIHSDNFLKNNISLNIENFDVLINLFKKSNEHEKYYILKDKNIIFIKKDLTDDKEIILAIVKDMDLSELEKKYLNIILLHLIHSMNLLNLANYDSLTKLLNRNAISSRIKKELQRTQRYNKKLSIILLDIDNFKKINDTYGHITGDIILKNIANLIKAQLRDSDYVGRWGGEEFLIVLPETSLDKATEIAERIRKLIEHHTFEINGTNIHLTASLGVASVEEHGISIDELIQAADIALYSAKTKGKNKVLVLSKDKIKEFIHKEFIKQDELKNIFEKDNLVPFFQGIHDINSDNFDIFGFEVLARVKTKYGYTSASNFISDFIKFGFIEKLDIIIQNKALEYIASKNLKNYKFFFNLSKAYIHNIKNFENFIKKCEDLNIDTSQIVFEITEEEAITEINTVREIIRMAKNKNMQFALDDFGAGYSTFSYIKYFDLDYIKLDGSLIKDVSNQRDNRIILEGIIHISKIKNIKTIAEWVEKDEDLKVLKQLGIDYAQGFLLSKPQKEITQ